jgi:amidophosphoribosyltransferase
VNRPIYEECGVTGVWLSQGNAIPSSLFGLIALQHRGQESAGLASVRAGQIRLKKGMGLVEDVFKGADLESLAGPGAIGHVRYSTSGGLLLVNGQPLYFNSRLGPMALAHNGNLVNAPEIRAQLEQQGSIFQTSTDSEVIAHLLARATTSDVADALVSALGQVQGAYSLVILTPDRILAVRDPFGLRPLCLGRLEDGYVVASETCALDTMGASFLREVEPGEMVILSDQGLESCSLFPPRRKAFCIFEYIYFARPDSIFNGLTVHNVRRELGRLLAQEAPVEADLVIGVPDSSLSAAAGFAEGAGLPCETGLVRNRYLGRTFIRPSQEQRERGVALKLNPITGVVAGKRVVLVDDSIVRGTTSQRIVTMLKSVGAREVHLRIASPPVQYPCGLGIDTRDDLVAARMNPEEICQFTGADSLAFLSIETLLGAVLGGAENHCLGCFAGNHPVGRDYR